MIRPSRWWYLVGIIVAFAGAGWSAIDRLGVVDGRVGMMHRIVIPGHATFPFVAGEYLGYYEPRSVVDGKEYATSEMFSGLLCAIRDAKEGKPIATTPAPMVSSYEVPPFAGVSIFSFVVPKAGDYQFACRRPKRAEGEPPVVIALGTNMERSTANVLSVPAGFVAIGTAIWLVIFVLRRRSASSLQKLAAKRDSRGLS